MCLNVSASFVKSAEYGTRRIPKYALFGSNALVE